MRVTKIVVHMEELVSQQEPFYVSIPRADEAWHFDLGPVGEGPSKVVAHARVIVERSGKLVRRDGQVVREEPYQITAEFEVMNHRRDTDAEPDRSPDAGAADLE